MAFDGKRPVAIAALAFLKTLAISWRRGHQGGRSQARRPAGPDREADRARRAKRLLRSLVSETLSILEHSLRNLQRAGFRQVYEKEVYEWDG